ncbi:hypothetical protein, partial [Pseudomonas sp. PA-1-2A]|uniref:hypothetical protein n=1 Tax=Pseudomonas sp. PA-1-2A TaxID=2665464 RepID=UPI001F40BA7A
HSHIPSLIFVFLSKQTPAQQNVLSKRIFSGQQTHVTPTRLPATTVIRHRRRSLFPISSYLSPLHRRVPTLNGCVRMRLLGRSDTV